MKQALMFITVVAVSILLLPLLAGVLTAAFYIGTVLLLVGSAVIWFRLRRSGDERDQT